MAKKKSVKALVTAREIIYLLPAREQYDAIGRGGDTHGRVPKGATVQIAFQDRDEIVVYWKTHLVTCDINDFVPEKPTALPPRRTPTTPAPQSKPAPKFELGKAGSEQVMSETYDVWLNPDKPTRKPLHKHLKSIAAVEAAIAAFQKREPTATFSIVAIRTIQRVVRFVQPE